MSNNVDYTIQYRRWHDGSSSELVAAAKLYDRWIGHLVKQHPSGCKVLDYGCAFGSLVYYLKTHFEDVYGVDASEHQIEVAKRHGLPVDVLPIGDFPSWCASNTDTFDIIFLFDVLEHIPVSDQIVFMRLLSGTLKESGLIYIKVPNANSLLASRWRYIDWTHLSSFTECSLEFVCLNSGLGEIEYFDDESSMKPRYWWVPRWSMRYFYLKSLSRLIWKLYLRSELGRQSQSIRIGYNLFARAKKL